MCVRFCYVVLHLHYESMKPDSESNNKHYEVDFLYMYNSIVR